MRVRRLGGFLAAAAIAAAGLVVSGGAPAGAAGPVGFTVIGTVESSSCQLARIDLSTGVLTPFGPTDALHCTFDLALAPDGVTLYGTTITGSNCGCAPPNSNTAHAHLIRYNTTSGAATDLGQIGSFVTNGPPGALQGNLTFDSTGALFVYLVPNLATGTMPCEYRSFCLYRVDPTNPSSATALGHVPQTFTVYFGLAAPCSGPVLAARQTSDPSQFGGEAPNPWRAPLHAEAISPRTLTSVNTSSGSTTDIGSGMGVGNGLESLDFDGAGGVWGIGFLGSSATSQVFTIDATTGVATAGAAVTNGGAPTTIEALAIAPPCPVPGAAAPTVVVVTPRFTG